MRKRIAFLIVMAMLSGSVHAGGRARIVSLQAPREVAAGQSFQFSFVVRPEYLSRHRKVEPLVTATSNGRVVTVPAVATRPKDRYAATIALPEAGDWNIRVDSRFCETIMAPLTVRAVARAKS